MDEKDEFVNPANPTAKTPTPAAAERSPKGHDSDSDDERRRSRRPTVSIQDFAQPR